MEEPEEKTTGLSARPVSILGTGREHSQNRKLAIGRMVAYSDQQAVDRKFSVGKIVRVNVLAEKVLIVPYESKYISTGNLASAKWRPEVRKGSPRKWIDKRDVLTPFELTSSGVMPAIARTELTIKLTEGYRTEQDDDSDAEPLRPCDMDDQVSPAS
jgi:hypothetical protein